MQEKPANEGPAPNDKPDTMRRNPTMKMATLAIHNMMRASETETKRANVKDLISELMLPISSLALIIAICFSGAPQVKVIAFALPLVAFFYYIYRRIGTVAHLEVRQAYITWRLLIATFLFGGTFALFSFFVITYITTTLLNRA